MDSIQTFETILQYGSRDTTYKFGLLLSVVDYVIEQPLQPAINNFHFIPIFYLAKQFLAYYYPLITDKVRQGPIRSQKRSIELEKFFEAFTKRTMDNASLPFSTRTSSTIHKLYATIEFETIPLEVRRLLHRIRRTILEQPLQYIRNLKGGKTSFFGLLAKNTDYDLPFENHRKAGLSLKWRDIEPIKNWEELEAHENCHLFLSHQTYREISSMRFWLRDVLIKRWTQECIDRFNCQDPNVMSKFDLWKIPPERDSALMQKYHRIYQNLGLTFCIYCDVALKEHTTHLDHFLPWSRLPINRFWNLYPACSSCNLKKKDKIPQVSEALEMRLKHHLLNCIQSVREYGKNILEKDVDFLYRKTFHSPKLTIDLSRMADEIYEYLLSLRNELFSTLPGSEYKPPIIDPASL